MSIAFVARILIERQGLFRLTPQQINDRRNTLPLDHAFLTSINVQRINTKQFEKRVASLSWTKGQNRPTMHYFSVLQGAAQTLFITFCY